MDTLDSLGDALDFPDDFNAISLDADPLIEVHSVTLHPHDKYKSYNIYGKIYAVDKKEGRNDLYKRGWNSPETINSSGNTSLSLTGPVSGVISMVGEPVIFVELKVRPKSRRKKGSITWFAKVHSVLDTTTHLCYDEIKSLTLQGSLGEVRVDYIVMPCACIANVRLSLTREGEKPLEYYEADDVLPDDIVKAHVFGSVIASYGTATRQFGGEGYVKQRASFILYERSEDNKGTPVAYGSPIKLGRSFVCMPVYSSFLLTLNLTFRICGGGDTEEFVVKGSTEFKTTDNTYPKKSRFSFREFSVQVSLRLHTCDNPIFLDKIHKSTELSLSAFKKRGNIPEEISLWGRDRIEVLSVVVGHDEREEIDDLWGIIAVQFSHVYSSNHHWYIFKRDEKHPANLCGRQGKALSLEGLTTERTDWFYLCLRLKDIYGLVDIHNNLFITEQCYQVKRQWFDRPLCSVLLGKHGFAVVHYIIFREAAKATVSISVVPKKVPDSDSVPVVYGALVVQYSNDGYPTSFQKNYWRSVLFEEPQEKGARHLSDDGGIPLSKNVVSVPLGWALVIDVDLHLHTMVRPPSAAAAGSLGVCNAEAAEHFKDKVEFEIGGIGCKKLLGQYYDVHFSIEWTEGM